MKETLTHKVTMEEINNNISELNTPMPYILRDRKDVYSLFGTREDICTMNKIGGYELSVAFANPDVDW